MPTHIFFFFFGRGGGREEVKDVYYEIVQVGNRPFSYSGYCTGTSLQG